MEHLHHYGISQDPFSNELDLRFYFDSACHRDALRRVERGMRQNKGLTILTGEAGTGKTLLARRIFEALEEEVFEASLMVVLPGAADAHAILSRFARQLGVEEPAPDRSGLLAQIYEGLAIVREDGRHAVLVIDDAHVLSSEAMAEIGGLLNMEYEERRLISLLLVGLPELDERLAGDAALVQRVDVRVRLMPLDLINATSYIAHRLAAVGARLEIIPAATVESLSKFSRGRPRLINTLADNALFEAYLAGRPQIESSDVERAANDLGIGPDPGTTYTQLAPSPSLQRDSSGTTSSPVVGDITDPDAGPALDLQVAEQRSPTADVPRADLGALLEPVGGVAEELTTVLGADFEAAADTIDLDSEVMGLMSDGPEELPLAPLPTFEAASAGPGAMAEATQIALPDANEEEIVSSDIQELDDLFIELIED